NNVFGKTPGRAMRNFSETFPEVLESGVILVQAASVILPEMDSILVTGGKLTEEDCKILASNITNYKKVILINPRFFPQELNLAPAFKDRMEIYFGEFGQSSTANAWQDYMGKPVHRMEGIGDYVTNWPEIIFQNLP